MGNEHAHPHTAHTSSIPARPRGPLPSEDNSYMNITETLSQPANIYKRQCSEKECSGSDESCCLAAFPGVLVQQCVCDVYMTFGYLCLWLPLHTRVSLCFCLCISLYVFVGPSLAHSVGPLGSVHEPGS